MPGRPRVRYICKICKKIVTVDDQEKHLKRHNFDASYLKSNIAYKENFIRESY